MYKFKNLITISAIGLIFLSACTRHVTYRANHSRVHTQNHNYSMPMTPARNMSELDEQSRNVKPHLVYSYPKNIRVGRTNFVNLDPIKYQILNYINNIRANGNQCGPSAPPLTWNRKLEDAAISHAQDMASKNFLGHMGSGTDTDPARKALGQGSNFYERIIYFGFPIQPGELAGEILTYTKYDIVGNKIPYANFKHAVDNFLSSPRHCALLMNPRFNDIGIASYKDSEKMYWDIEFAEVK